MHPPQNRLISQAHLLVDGLRPGALDQVGLGKDSLEALNPGLVVVRISDFGHTGPLRDRDATPLTVQAASGWVNNRDPGRPPVQAGGEDFRVRRRGLRRARRAHRVENHV